MSTSTDRPTRTKALLAVAFAGSMLTSQLPALCQQPPADPSSASFSSSMIEVIATNAISTPEEKAYYLLQLAHSYLSGSNPTNFETYIKARLGPTGNCRPLYGWGRGEHPLVSLANDVSVLSHSAASTAQFGAGLKRFPVESRAVTDKAVEAAIAQLGQGFKNPEALNMYLIASCLSQITGNTLNEQKCNKVLNEAIQACEADNVVDSVQIKIVSSILNSMAYGLVPIRIPDYQEQSPVKVPTFGMKDVDECERLKLRATAILDRLPTTDQARRKAHRDLSLWYSYFGKCEESLKEKQELFNLVGVKDDRILYPQSGACGHLVWWSAEKLGHTGSCGMG
ncbi:hypothetical protein KBI23_14670 [bacterium]|nr:hypothetical protein [bacterium]MBP9808004.1 hypothetical protein [bacterium]